MKKYNIKRRTISQTNSSRKLSEITKLKISKKTKKRFNNPKNNPMFGKSHTEEAKEKMVKNHPRISGKDHHLYNPNLTNKDRIERRGIPKYKQWSKNILNLFNYTCQSCNDSTGGNLVAHHLEGWHWCKELRYEINNGICLCENCHNAFHKIFGYIYNTTKQYVQFIVLYNE